jgi:hypothetical protein
MVEALGKGCAGHPWPKDRPDRRFLLAIRHECGPRFFVATEFRGRDTVSPLTGVVSGSTIDIGL